MILHTCTISCPTVLTAGISTLHTRLRVTGGVARFPVMAHSLTPQSLPQAYLGKLAVIQVGACNSYQQFHRLYAAKPRQRTIACGPQVHLRCLAIKQVCNTASSCSVALLMTTPAAAAPLSTAARWHSARCMSVGTELATCSCPWPRAFD